jgi:hypothetical protein
MKTQVEKTDTMRNGGKHQASSSKDKPAPRPRNFPRVTLEEALVIPLAIKEKNGGNPWATADIAKAVKASRTTPKFFYLAAGARDYGVTDGTRDSEQISLTPLGRSVVYPQSAAHERAAKLQAFLSVDVFRKVLTHYKGNNLPEKEYLSNTLITAFDIAAQYHDEFVQLFRRNCEYLEIGKEFELPQDGELLKLNGSAEGGQSRIHTVTLSAPEKGKGPLCFVIMPFVERENIHPSGFFKEVLESLIVPACSELGFVVRSANREGSDVIQSTIINDLLEADLVVADLTEHNPNVLFELGMRMREDKPIAIIKAKGTGRIFDVDNMLRVYDYDPCLWTSTLKLDLPNVRNHVKATWDNRDREVSYMKLLRQSKAGKLEAVGA